MSPQCLCRIRPIREEFLLDSTAEEDRIVSEHFRYLQQLTRDGVVLLAGRTLNTDPTSFGIVILEAESDDAARALMENDPAVRASVFRAELFPFGVALASPRVSPP